jgi:hypothetical protein
MSNQAKCRIFRIFSAMNTPPLNANAPLRWVAYVKAGAFVLPALLAWSFSTVFLFPKLQQVWAEAGFAESAFHSLMRSSNAVMSHSVWIVSALLVLFGFLEWRGGAWVRYRQMCLGIGVWFLNTAVLLLVTAMLLSALMVAPGLVPRQ